MKKIVVLTLCLSLLACAAPVFAGTASEDLGDVYENTEAFDGGPGSTLNVSPSGSEQ